MRRVCMVCVCVCTLCVSLPVSLLVTLSIHTFSLSETGFAVQQRGFIVAASDLPHDISLEIFKIFQHRVLPFT